MEHFKRIASAVVILPPLLAFLYLASHSLFLVFVLLLVMLSLREYVQMLLHAQQPVYPSATYAVGILLTCVAFLGGEHYMSLGVSLGLLTLLVTVLLSPQYGANRFPALIHSLFGVFFIGWNLSYLLLLHSLPTGKWYIFFLCVVVWVGDSTAMYVGQGMGHHKLAPAISPGKTWEGAVGCLVGGVVTAGLAAHFLLPQLAFWQHLLLGLVISVAAQASDLSESLIKRYAGVKDSGELIPGHGGILDRIDSLLFAAPLLLYALQLFVPTPTP